VIVSTKEGRRAVPAAALAVMFVLAVSPLEAQDVATERAAAGRAAAAQDAAAGDPVEALERQVEALRAEIEALRRELRAAREEPAPGAPATEDAGDAAEDEEADALAELERKIEVLAAEVERLRIGAAPPGAPAVAEAGEGEVPRAFGLAPAASKVYRAERGLSIGGYGEMLYERKDGDRNDRLDFLRAIVYFGYKFDDRFVFNSEIEVEHADEAFLEFAYLDWLYRPELNLRGGLVLLPMGLVNEIHEPTTFFGARRPDVEQAILPTTWRENGFGAFGEVGPFSYRTYVVNGLNGAAFTSGGLRGGRQKGSQTLADDLAWVGRVDWDAVPGLLVGGSAYVGDSGQDLPAPGGGRIDAGTTIVEGHAEWRWRGLRLRGLVARAELDDVARLNATLGLTGAQSVGEELRGHYVEAGYDLFSGRGGRASLTPYVRREEVDTQAEVPRGFSADPANDRESLTLGLAFQPIDPIVLKVDYQDYDNGAGTGVDQLNVALGYIF